MKIVFNGGKSGWSEYVLNGTKTKQRDKSKIEVIDGDLELTKNIYESTKYKENYIRGVIAFQGKINSEKMKKVYEEFKELLMIGYEEDEYNIAAIIHKDTDNDHIHFCIPKLNLITNKQNHIYYDKTDRERINTIRDYLIIKHNLKENENTLEQLEKEQKELSRLEIWRKTHKQKLPSLTRKRSQIKAQEDIKNYINELIESKIITNLDDTKQAIKELELNIVNQGFDKNGNFDYITIQDEQKNKIRLKGEVYGDKYYTEKNRRDETKSLKSNSQNRIGTTRKLTELREKLQKENERHKQYIFKRYRATEKERESILGQNNNNFNTIFNSDFYSTNFKNDGKQHTNNNNKQQESDDISQKSIFGNERESTIHIHNKGVENDNTNTTNENTKRTIKDITRTRDSRFRKIYDDNTKTIQRITETISNVGGKIQQFGERIKGGIMKNKDELEDFKKEINIADLANNLDFKLDKKKSSKNCLLMEKNGDKILISRNSMNEHYTYFNLNNAKGGSVVDFYNEFINTKKQPFFKTVLALRQLKKDLINDPNFNIKTSTKDTQETLTNINKLQELKDKTYLKDRYLSNKTIQEFENYIKQDEKNNICFIHKKYEFEGGLKIENVGIEKKNNDFKGHEGSKGIWGKQIGDKKDLYIFESPLDLMSFYELHKKEGMYVSTAGNTSETGLESLKNIVNKIDFVSINYCLDNDNGGEKVKERIDNIFSLSHPERVIIKPKFKDFNEDLKELKLEQERQEEQQRQQEELKKQEQEEQQRKRRNLWEIRGR